MSNEQLRDLYMDFLKMDCFGFLMCRGDVMTKHFIDELEARKPVLFKDSYIMQFMVEYEEQKKKLKL